MKDYPMRNQHGEYSMKLPLHVGTGRGHHETIFDRNGEIVAYTTGQGKEWDAAAAQEFVAAVNGQAALRDLTSALKNLYMRAVIDHPLDEHWRIYIDEAAESIEQADPNWLGLAGREGTTDERS